MKINDVIYGFRVNRVRHSEELGGKLWEMTYEKTGTELVWMDNGESNKLFSIAFKTLPSDDTGVFHILEHSVLNGSDKYPVKEPFVELLKSSMNTFLNAMTFPDKTLYPVSSRNERDLLNLVSVYLDAVFCPAIYRNPCIFQQEGWHYELNKEDNAPIYKGVVFNEMKGAFSSSDTVLANTMSRLLFPDNCYRYVSGGDPAHIPELTYEQFLDAHREYYHPSNARIYLDGAVPLDQILQMLEQYLSRYEKSGKVHTIAPQLPPPASRITEYYAVGEDEDTEFMSYLSLGKIVCDWSDQKKIFALMVLGSYLTGTNESPLKRAVLQSGLAQDISFGVADGVAQPYCTLDIRNTEPEHCDQLKEIVEQTVFDLVRNGLNAEELDAVISQMEFQMLQTGEPKGLMRNITALNSWLYGGDPMLCMECKEQFRVLRQMIGTGYYEQLLNEILLDPANWVEVLLLPSTTKGMEDRQAEAARLQEIGASWSAAQRTEILNMNAALTAWQNSADTQENLSTLPVLPLCEISPEPEKVETEEYQIGTTAVLLHKVADKGILHINLHFSLADCKPEDLSAISFITNLFGELPTKQHTVAQLQQLIRKNIGMLDYNVTAYTDQDNANLCRAFFTVSASMLEDRAQTAVALIAEILKDTVFTGEENSITIENILLQGEDGVRQSIIIDGHRFANLRGASHFTAGAAVQERTEGFAFYSWLQDFVRNMDEKMEAFQQFAQMTADRIFRANRLTMSITAQQRNAAAEHIVELLHSGIEPVGQYLSIPVDGIPAKEFIQIPAGVSYAVSSGTLRQYGQSYDGCIAVLGNILSYDYLWNKIRVQGGAYGCGFHATQTRNIMFYSYRDPSAHASLEAFRNTADYIRSFCADEPALDKYIISTVASTEPLRTPAQQGSTADSDYFCGITYEDHCRIRSEMRSAKWQDLLKYCSLFEEMGSRNACCIIGGSEDASQCDNSWVLYSV